MVAQQRQDQTKTNWWHNKDNLFVIGPSKLGIGPGCAECYEYTWEPRALSAQSLYMCDCDGCGTAHTRQLVLWSSLVLWTYDTGITSCMAPRYRLHRL